METPEQIMKRYNKKQKATPMTPELNAPQFWVFVGKVMGLTSALAITLLILLLSVLGVLWTAKQILNL